MSDSKSPLGGVALLTEEQIRAIVGDAVRDAMNSQKTTSDGYLDTAAAAAYLKTTVRSIQHAVARDALVPDHRGSRGGGLKGNRFKKATLDEYMKRRAG